MKHALLHLTQLDPIETMVANSYKDFHTKGFDYICLYRRPELTLKVYFFNGDVRKLPEVVNPHDHRYTFMTEPLAGCVENVDFTFSPTGKVYNRFEYRTPLNGGNGFTWKEEMRLKEYARQAYRPGQQYLLHGHQLHTIRIVEEGTILLLLQGPDTMPLDQPTYTYTPGNEPPSLSGLYSKFTADQIIDYLKVLGVPPHDHNNGD